MDREEIIRRAQYQTDERENNLNIRGDVVSFLISLIVSLVVVGIQFVMGEPHYEIFGIIIFSSGIGDIYRFKKISGVQNLRNGILKGVVGVAVLISSFCMMR